MTDRYNQRLLLAPLGLGLEVAAIVMTLTVVGLWVDRHYGSAPWGTLIGAGLGLAGGLYGLLRGANRALQATAGPRSSDDSPAEASSGARKQQASDRDGMT